jgi:parallel beta-helix repeat protein
VLDAHLFTFQATQGARFINNDLGNVEGGENIGRMVLLTGNGADNVFANNTFHDCENVLALSVRMPDSGISKRSHIHHNVFKGLNMNRGGEGTTTVQLASSGRLPYEDLLMQAVVEYNYFENIMGDAETISNKSNENTIRHNTLINTKSLVIRQGHNVTVEDNVLVNTTGPAIRMHGSGHKVNRNTIKSSKGDGIALTYGMGSGLEARTHRVAVTDGRFSDNLIENAGANGIFLGYGKGNDLSGHKREKQWNTGVLQNIPPSGNVITGNTITNSKLAAIEMAGASENIIKNNTIN